MLVDVGPWPAHEPINTVTKSNNDDESGKRYLSQGTLGKAVRLKGRLGSRELEIPPREGNQSTERKFYDKMRNNVEPMRQKR